LKELFEQIQYLKGVGPKRSNLLKRLGIETIWDMLWYIPRSYFDAGNTEKISSLRPGSNARIKATVSMVKQSRTSRGLSLFKAKVADESGTITAVWFNQAYLAGIIRPGQEIYLSGKVKNVYGEREINVAYYDLAENGKHQAGILPVYPLTEGLSQKVLRNLVTLVLDNYLRYYPEILEKDIKNKYQLDHIQVAMRNIHFPKDREAYWHARRRLAFEELYLFQINMCREKEKRKNDHYIVHQPESGLVNKTLAGLPFRLTAGQLKALNEVFADMESPRQMNRLLQGDVGSGKTVVAALAIAKSASGGYQSALMAPTEILAEQHFLSINQFFAQSDVTIARLTGSTPSGERRSILEAAAMGNVDVVVGTHTLIQDEINFANLGLVIIDEQHRFGVRQRATLGRKGYAPDILVMTATPIPRTLALTAYGDLDLSIISELPPGRKPVKTLYIRNEFRNRAYQFLRKQIEKGEQAYIVCPLVEESEKQDLTAAVSLYNELSQDIFPQFNVGLLHGRMKASEKDEIMQLFKQGGIKVLVSTTVIEVGVDVPNATVMVVEQAERFGLSQLHQLRGRVGRGSRQSYCLLIGNPKTEEGFRRLKAMERSNDGFELANEDLALRGPGEFWGVKQHGLDLFRVADLVKDRDLVLLTRMIVNEMEADTINDNQLTPILAYKFQRSRDIARN
jgi:ATP-dependent DNA helicase RecG